MQSRPARSAGAFDDVPITHEILTAVAEREGVAPTDLDEPLYGVVDPDALESLFRTGTGTVTFSYLGYEVVVHSDDRVSIQG